MSNIEKTITLQFKAETDKAQSKTAELEKTLKSLNQQLTGYSNTRLGTTIRTVGKEADKTYKYIYRLNKEGNLDLISKNIKNASKESNALVESFKKMAKVTAAIGIGATAISKTAKSIKDTVNYSIQASEALNLFNVAFGNVQENGETTFSELGKAADEFQSKLQKNFGANITESRTYQALYQQMATAGGIAEEAASIMSENSTKLVYDLASLFNKEEKDVADNIRSGIYAGQSKVLYQYGIDITDAGMETILEDLKSQWKGLENESISGMTRAEKEMLRYITVLKQTQKAQGDYANTIESPANQLRVLKNEFVNMAATLGNLFVAPFQKILQFANAIIRTVRYVGEAIASLFGIDAQSYNTSVASGADAWDDVSDSIDDAASSASKYKKQLLGFDEVHNINENTDSGSGTSGGINTEWYDILASELGSYDNGLDNIKLKAEEISETLMSWLGFEKDAETGIWQFGPAYDNLLKSASKLKDAFAEFGNAISPIISSILDNVIKPLGEVVINDILPGFLDILSGALQLLGRVIEDVRPAIEFMLENLIKPLIEFTGSLLGDVLDGIGKALKWIADNEIALSIIEGIITSIVLVNLAIGIYNGLITIFTAVTTAASASGGIFAGVLAAINSPLLLIELAIGAVIAVVILLVKHWDTVKEVGIAAWEGIKEAWDVVKDFFGDIGSAIGDIFSNAWDGLKTGASDAWEGIKQVFSGVANFFEDTFTKAWTKVKKVFSTGGQIFTGIKDGIVKAFATIVNTIIKGINKVVSLPFKGINTALKKIRDISIAGVHPFKDLIKLIDVPQIPLLAYKNGGFPEDGMFFANHGELVGKFSNGKTAVANNEQITEGIRRAVATGMSQAMSNNGGNTKFEFSIGEGIIVKKVVNGINEITKSTGESPLII